MITKQETEHIAKLARLGLTKKEIGEFQKELSVILDYFEKLKKADISNVKAFSQSVLLENVMREDEAKKQDLEIVDRLIKAAPDREKRYVKVKSVL
ncbi:Asp-tRNA(Asn)/Glu-tRNA(Gln) amidotransferase subunit GatC [Candidatus Parcubacteria bacterium]|nr:Asp-tRNA(Asn)/Glu-tRNA(Gln) amidotransferase subunit GatC [Candidatus Parcubacteria bacterium]